MGCLNLQVINASNNDVRVLAKDVNSHASVDALSGYDYLVKIDGRCDVKLTTLLIRNPLDVLTDRKNGLNLSAGLVCSTNLGVEDGVLWVKEGMFLTLSNGRIILNYE